MTSLVNFKFIRFIVKRSQNKIIKNKRGKNKNEIDQRIILSNFPIRDLFTVKRKIRKKRKLRILFTNAEMK